MPHLARCAPSRTASRVRSQTIGGTVRRPRRLTQQTDRPSPGASYYLSPSTGLRPGFRRMLERLGKAAKMAFGVHPHMLRHACGFKLANQGVDTRSLQHYLGHKNIQHTVRYTELSPDRFRGFWKD